MLNGDLFNDLLGDDEDQPDKPVPSRKVLKKKNALKANKIKKPDEAINEASPSLNEIDGPLSSGVELSAETVKPEIVSNENDDDDDDGKI